MKLHLGCGYKKLQEFINVDCDQSCAPDVLCNLETDTWPFENNSVDEVVAHHIFEHFGDPGYFHFLKELYRVCKDGATIDVVVPHPRHDCFLNDPTHRRPITIEGLRMFSKSFNKYCIETGDGSSKLGLVYDVDFEILNFSLTFDAAYVHLLQDMTDEKEAQIKQIIRECNNVIVEYQIKWMVIK